MEHLNRQEEDAYDPRETWSSSEFIPFSLGKISLGEIPGYQPYISDRDPGDEAI